MGSFPRNLRLAAVLAFVALVGSPRVGAGAPAESMEPISPLPQTVDEDERRMALGKHLFGDVRVSRGDVIACATCHPLNRGGVDGRSRAVGIDGKLLRNTPTVFNVRYSLYLNWDGAHESLTAHAERVLVNPSLTGMNWPDLTAKIKGIAEYARDFALIYPEGVTKASIVDALVSYERSLVTPNARFDRYLRGQRDAISADEARGYQLFKSYGCVACHQGVNIGGNLLQRFGVFAVVPGAPANDADKGRLLVTKDPRDEGVFRVPSLRNVAVTGPYFHDGRAATLEDAVQTMAKAQLGRTLSSEDIRLIVAFLRTLTGEFKGQSLSSDKAAVPGK
jgi:cytochrome c peroxidase